MSAGRIVSGLAASVVVAGCAVVAVGMSQAGGSTSTQHRRVASAAPPTFRPAYVPRTPAPGSASASTPDQTPSTPRPSAAIAAASTRPPRAIPTRSSASRVVTPAPQPALITPAPARRTTHPAPAPHPVSRTATHRPRPPVVHHAPRGRPLPLGGTTGSATRVITVSASSASSTTAVLQAWSKARAGGWRKHGRAVTAHLGADGVSRHASESRSATPIGSFTLTRAFGHDADPGTALPYRRTSPADWWISEPGRLYNTFQHCSSGCGFNQGSPNEHLFYETPFYDYAVVIDYNTRNAPGGVRQGRGSAFFLHVTDGNPTAGCVSIPASRLVPMMRWLTPTAHPRILIGIS